MEDGFAEQLLHPVSYESEVYEVAIFVDQNSQISAISGGSTKLVSMAF